MTDHTDLIARSRAFLLPFNEKSKDDRDWTDLLALALDLHQGLVQAADALEAATPSDHFQITRDIECDPFGKTFPAWMKGVVIGGFREQGWTAYYEGRTIATGQWGDFLARTALAEQGEKK